MGDLVRILNDAERIALLRDSDADSTSFVKGSWRPAGPSDLGIVYDTKILSASEKGSLKRAGGLLHISLREDGLKLEFSKGKGKEIIPVAEIENLSGKDIGMLPFLFRDSILIKYEIKPGAQPRVVGILGTEHFLNLSRYSVCPSGHEDLEEIVELPKHCPLTPPEYIPVERQLEGPWWNDPRRRIKSGPAAGFVGVMVGSLDNARRTGKLVYKKMEDGSVWLLRDSVEEYVRGSHAVSTLKKDGICQDIKDYEEPVEKEKKKRKKRKTKKPEPVVYPDMEEDWWKNPEERLLRSVALNILDVEGYSLDYARRTGVIPDKNVGGRVFVYREGVEAFAKKSKPVRELDAICDRIWNYDENAPVKEQLRLPQKIEAPPRPMRRPRTRKIQTSPQALRINEGVRAEVRDLPDHLVPKSEVPDISGLPTEMEKSDAVTWVMGTYHIDSRLDAGDIVNKAVPEIVYDGGRKGYRYTRGSLHDVCRAARLKIR